MVKLELEQRLDAAMKENAVLRAANAELRATNDALRVQLGRGNMTRHEEMAVAKAEAMRLGRVVKA